MEVCVYMDIGAGVVVCTYSIFVYRTFYHITPTTHSPTHPHTHTHIAGEHQRRFLAYNNDGCITCKYDEEVGINILEVSFHDTSKHKKRVPLLNDFFGITMASLGGQV